MVTTLTGIGAEVSALQTAFFRNTISLARSFFSSNRTLSGNVAIHLHGGWLAPSFLYTRWHEYLNNHIQHPPPIHMPLIVLKSINEIPYYTSQIPKVSGVYRINIGHSLGGVAAARDLFLHSDEVDAAILVATTIRPESLADWLKYIFYWAMGFDPKHLPHYIEEMKKMLKNQDCLKKLFIITGNGDTFFPPDTCKVLGAHCITIDNVSHVGFATDEKVMEAICKIVRNVMRPRRIQLVNPSQAA